MRVAIIRSVFWKLLGKGKKINYFVCANESFSNDQMSKREKEREREKNDAK